MTANERAENLAQLLIAARNGEPRVPSEWEDAAPLSEREAYAVQEIVAHTMGPVGGFKVANRAGHPRIMAPIFSKHILPSAARLEYPEHEEVGIELELGFRVESPLPPLDSPGRDGRLAECLSLVVVIEVVLTRLSGTPSPLMKLADNQINGALIVGDSQTDWHGLDLSRVNARLTFGDEVILDRFADIPGGNALANFKALEEIVGNHCGGLNPGQIVITGSLNGLPYIRPGQIIRGSIEGVGEVALDLARTC